MSTATGRNKEFKPDMKIMLNFDTEGKIMFAENSKRKSKINPPAF